MNDCPSKEALTHWLEAGPAGDSDPGLAGHVEACPRCQNALEQLTALADTPGSVPAGELGRLRCLLQANTVPAHEAAAAAHLPGLPGYEILSELGRGGMGVVYQARQASPNRLVAVKMIRAGEGATPEEVIRFGVEAETVARLQHPNIVQIYEVGVGQQPYFALEYVAGGNLDHRIAGRPQPPQQAAALVEALASAIQHAHDQGIVHRDLKPANVLLSADGTPKVADFGMARLLHADLRLTRTGAVAGTPAYMAPEQAQPGKSGVGPAADVYALGTILYEMLTGRPPFVGESALDVLRQVTDCEPVSPSRLVPRVPRDLETICLKCLAKEPRRRYATAAALADDLRRFQDGQAVRARPVGAAGQAWRWCRRNPGTAAALAVSVVALLAGTAVSLLFALEASRNAAAEKDAREQAQLNEARAVAEKARADDEADLARGVNTFLRFDLLQQADPQTHAQPGQSPDRDIKLRRVLDLAAKRIGGRFPDRPLVEAAIRNSIGIAYSGLGEYDLALPHLQAAYDVQSKLLGTDHPDALDSLSGLGNVYQMQGRYLLAEEISRKALDGYRRLRGADHRDTLLAQNHLAAVYLQQGHYAEAGPLLETTLKLARQKYSNDDSLDLQVQNNQARLLMARGEFPRAEALLSRLLQTSRQKLGADHPLTLNAQHNLAILYQNEGRFEKAEPMLVKTWKARAKYLGADHPITLNCRTNLANLFVRQGRYDDAERIYLQVLKVQQGALGADHSDTLATQHNLAQLYVTRRQFDRAEPLLMKTWEARRQILGEDHLDTLSSQHSLALYYLARHRHAEAEPLFVKTLAARRALLGDSHPETLAAQNNLAGLYLDKDQPERAEPLLAQTYAARRRHLGPDHPTTLSAQGNLALTYLRLGRYDRAEALFDDARDGYRRTGAGDRLPALQTRYNRALASLVQGKTAEAGRLFTQLLADCLPKLGDKHPLTVQAKFNLAVLPALKAAGERYQKTLADKGADHPDTLTARLRWAVALRDRFDVRYAAPHAEAVVAARRRLLQADHPDALEALHQLAGVRHRQGKLDEALTLERDVLDGARRGKGDADPFTLRLAREIHERCRQAEREGTLFADAAALLGRNLLAEEEYAEAEELLRACLKVRADKQPDDWTTFEARGLLGEALRGQKKYAEAEPLLTAGYQGMKARAKTIPPAYQSRLTEAAGRLAQLYEAWGKQDEARRWRAVHEAGSPSRP